MCAAVAAAAAGAALPAAARGLLLGLHRAGSSAGTLLCNGSSAAFSISAAPARDATATGALLRPAVGSSGDAVPAFVFDIDGVLIRGREVLPAARQAMQLVNRGTGTRVWAASMFSAVHKLTSQSALGCNPTFEFPHPNPTQPLQQLLRGGRWRAPVVFLTNGGGVTEARKAEELSGWLGAPVEEDQVRFLVIGCVCSPRWVSTLHRHDPSALC